MPFGAPLPVTAQEFGRGKPILSVVSGLHGDEYDGVYVCHRLIQWLRTAEGRSGPYRLRGRVRVIPAVNPAGLLVSARNWPFDNTDLDRVFPGYAQGETSQRLASWVFELIRHSDCCIDIHGSGQLAEMPQVQIYHGQPRALELAKAMGLPLIWVRRLTANSEMAPQALEVPGNVQGTLAYNLFQNGIDVMVVRAGQGYPLDFNRSTQVLDSLVRLMLQLGVVQGPLPNEPGSAAPEVCSTETIKLIYAERPGLFVPTTVSGSRLRAGDLLGEIIDPLKGEVVETIAAPSEGILISLRNHPVVLQASLIARIGTG